MYWTIVNSPSSMYLQPRRAFTCCSFLLYFFLFPCCFARPISSPFPCFFRCFLLFLSSAVLARLLYYFPRFLPLLPLPPLFPFLLVPWLISYFLFLCSWLRRVVCFSTSSINLAHPVHSRSTFPLPRCSDILIKKAVQGQWINNCRCGRCCVGPLQRSWVRT